MKETSVECQRRVDVDELMQYQIFIKNPLAKSALKKTFLPCKIKMKKVLKIIKQPLRAVPQKHLFTQKIK